MKQFGKIFINFFANKAKQILLLCIIAALYYFFGKLPYLSVILSEDIFSVFFFLIALLLVFKPSEKGSVIIACILTVFASIASIFSFEEILDIYGNAVYVLLFYIFIRYMYKAKKEIE